MHIVLNNVHFNFRAAQYAIFIGHLSYKLHCLALPDKRCLSHGLCLYEVVMTLYFLNDIVNDAESTQKWKIHHNH